MNESILLSIKKLLGISDYEDKSFDLDLIIHINSAFMVLQQLGLGPKYPFAIEGSTETWEDFLDNPDKFSAVKTYVYLKTKMVFDPPASGIITQVYNDIIREYEWRLNVRLETTV